MFVLVQHVTDRDKTEQDITTRDKTKQDMASEISLRYAINVVDIFAISKRNPPFIPFMVLALKFDGYSSRI